MLGSTPEPKLEPGRLSGLALTCLVLGAGFLSADLILFTLLACLGEDAVRQLALIGLGS